MGIVDTTRGVGFCRMSLGDSGWHVVLQLPLLLPQFARIRGKQGLERTISSKVMEV
jgi:hypothetical protein